MQIVIDIPEEVYRKAKETHDAMCDSVWLGIKNGTPLSKGHGDLIDRDDLLADSYCIDDWSGNEVNIVDVMTVEMADAIIEADKAESDIEKRKPCINYEDGCETWAGCPCIYYKAESEE